MIVIGITGGDKAGKSSTAQLIEQAIDHLLPESHVELYEISDTVRNLLESLRIDTEPKTPEIRAAMRDLIEIPMRFSKTVWLDAALAEAIEAQAAPEHLTALIVSGIRRDCEAAWVRERGGLVVFVNDGDGLGDVTMFPGDYVVVSPHMDEAECSEQVEQIVHEAMIRRAARPLVEA